MVGWLSGKLRPKTPFHIKFWGVRGTIGCGGPDVMRYGGNTTCFEIRCGDRLIIIDGGTGIRYLADEMHRRGDTDADILITHTHHDHVAGFLAFDPFFSPKYTFRMWAGHFQIPFKTADILPVLMESPFFPIDPSFLNADIQCKDFSQGDTLDLGDDIIVKTGPLNHPDGSTGYRIEFDNRAIAVITDTEHYPDRLDENILKLVDGADIMVYDSTYTDKEYPLHEGWGHSTWSAGVALAREAGVKTFVAHHHEPAHNDEFMDQVAKELKRAFPRGIVAREGMTLQA